MSLSIVTTKNQLYRPSGLYLGMWGAWWQNATLASSGSIPANPVGTGTSPTVDTTLAAVKQFESDTGTHCAIVHLWKDYNTSDTGTWGSASGSTGGFSGTDTFAVLNAILAHNSLPMITWSLSGTASPIIPTILAGTMDSYISGVAAQIAAWGHPILIRMMHEMNGNWYHGWSPGSTDSSYYVTPEDYRSCWRHIVDLCRAQGATNIQWVYCPNYWLSSSLSKPGMLQFPGSSYVDWIGLDFYNDTDTASSSAWTLFSNTNYGIHYAYNAITTTAAFNGIPLMVCETGCMPSADGVNTKAAWITDMLTTASSTAYNRLRAVVYFNQDERASDGGGVAGTNNPNHLAVQLEFDESDGNTTGSGSGMSAANAWNTYVNANPSRFNQSWP